MASLEHQIPTTSSSDRYATEAAQLYLKCLYGHEGNWRRHEPKTNLAEIVSGGYVNDNRERG